MKLLFIDKVKVRAALEIDNTVGRYVGYVDVHISKKKEIYIYRKMYVRYEVYLEPLITIQQRV